MTATIMRVIINECVGIVLLAPGIIHISPSFALIRNSIMDSMNLRARLLYDCVVPNEYLLIASCFSSALPSAAASGLDHLPELIQVHEATRLALLAHARSLHAVVAMRALGTTVTARRVGGIARQLWIGDTLQWSLDQQEASVYGAELPLRAGLILGRSGVTVSVGNTGPIAFSGQRQIAVVNLAVFRAFALHIIIAELPAWNG